MIIYGVSFGVSAGIVKTKLNYIEAKLDKHNNVVERTYKLEKDLSVVQEKQKVANNRINDLEEINKKEGM